MNLTLQQAIIQASSEHGRNIIPPFATMLPFYGSKFRVTFNECLRQGCLSNRSGTQTGLFDHYVALYAIPPLDVDLEDIFKGYSPDSDAKAIFSGEMIVRPLVRPLYRFQELVTEENDLKNAAHQCVKKGHDALVVPLNRFYPTNWARAYEVTNAEMDLSIGQILSNLSTVH